MVAERVSLSGKRTESALVGPGSLLDGAAFLSCSHTQCKVWAAGRSLLAAVGAPELDALVAAAEAAEAAAAAGDQPAADAAAADVPRAERLPTGSSIGSDSDADSMHSAREEGSRPSSQASVASAQEVDASSSGELDGQLAV